jgi:hypothetical protein
MVHPTRRPIFASTFAPASIDSALSADLKYKSTCIDSSQEARSVSEEGPGQPGNDCLANATGYLKKSPGLRSHLNLQTQWK